MKPWNRKNTCLSGAMGVCLMLPCVAMAVPDAFFININDATETMLGSLNAFGYIPATNPCILGGEFGAQPGAVCSVTSETANGLGAVDIHADYFEGNPFVFGATAIVNFNIFEPDTSIVSDTLRGESQQFMDTFAVSQ